jgi:hypothetical protein
MYRSGGLGVRLILGIPALVVTTVILALIVWELIDERRTT